MDPDVAQILLFAILVVDGIVWLIGLRFLVTSQQAGRSASSAETSEYDPSAVSSESGLTGSAEVEGQPSPLAAKAAATLAKGAIFGPVKIVEKSDNLIIFERLSPGIANQPAGRWFRQADLRFTPAGYVRTRVEWVVQLASMGWLLWLGGLFLILALIVLVVGGWAIHSFVVSSPDPTVRWQTFQMMQVVHFLWPPFLFGALYRRGVKEVAAQFEALAQNLPYCGD